MSLTSDIMKSFSFSNFRPGPTTLMQEYVATEMIFDQKIRLIGTDYLKSNNIVVMEIYFSLSQMPKPGKLRTIKDLLTILYYWFHIQEKVFIITKSLIALNLFLHKVIYVSMNFCQPISLIIFVIRGLNCFQYLEQIISFNNLRFGIMFIASVMWLSIVIIYLCIN